MDLHHLRHSLAHLWPGKIAAIPAHNFCGFSMAEPPAPKRAIVCGFLVLSLRVHADRLVSDSGLHLLECNGSFAHQSVACSSLPITS